MAKAALPGEPTNDLAVYDFLVQAHIPSIDVSALFAADSSARAATDRALMAAAASSGFLLIHALPGDVPLGAAARAAVLRLFDLPPEALLPGWRAAIARYYLGMERVSTALMRSIARGLGLPESYFDAYFRQGLSTLRLIRYPVRDDIDAASDPQLWITHGGERRYLTGVAHVDSGFLTLLAQDGVEGLQARHSNGDWIDVPPKEGTLAVNFGRVLERWCGGRIRATEHRVIGAGRERRSIPYFHEARADAEIAPLPLAGTARFEPFLFGDYLWATTTKFVEFEGMEGLRQPRGTASRPAG